MAGMDLGGQQLGMGRHQLDGDPPVFCRRHEQYVVGRRKRLGLSRSADCLEERIGLREVDDARDGDGDSGSSGDTDAHAVSGGHMEVGRGLLGDENTVVSAR